MPIVDSLITWIHLLSASIWVGGSLFIGIVIGPMLKSTTSSAEERIRLMIRIGRRFNVIAIPALAVLVATGIYNSHPLLLSASLGTLLDSTYGIILLIKIGLVLSMIGVYAAHVRISGTRAEEELLSGSKNPGPASIARMRAKMIWLGRVILGQSVAILLLAALLDSGI